MKKMLAALTAAAMTLGLAGCGETEELTIQNAVSELYIADDMNIGLRNIDAMMNGEQPEIDSVSYLGDEYCAKKEVLENINRLEKREERGLEDYTECIGFSMEVHYPKTPDVVLKHIMNDDWTYVKTPNPDSLWVLYARVGDGEWEDVYVGDHDILTHFD